MGRNALAVFDTEMKERMRARARRSSGTCGRRSSRNEFVVFYQPQLELASGRLRGYEALVRWERPGEGILSPRDFLAVAEETGLIRPIGDWVLRKACEDAASWLDSGTVAVNFSAAQFRSQEIDKTIAKVLQETGLAPERLEIEVPESLFLSDAPDVMEVLNRVKALGVRVAMDDFGAGYSGLASLAHFPFDKIKIDRSFVGQLTEDADVAAIVAAIVALGRTLSVDVTAEGVETSEQVTLLKAAGCSIVQGFLFGVPKRETHVGASERGSPTAHNAEQLRRQPSADPLELSAPRSSAAKGEVVSQARRRGRAGKRAVIEGRRELRKIEKKPLATARRCPGRGRRSSRPSMRSANTALGRMMADDALATAGALVAGARPERTAASKRRWRGTSPDDVWPARSRIANIDRVVLIPADARADRCPRAADASAELKHVIAATARARSDRSMRSRAAPTRSTP